MESNINPHESIKLNAFQNNIDRVRYKINNKYVNLIEDVIKYQTNVIKWVIHP